MNPLLREALWRVGALAGVATEREVRFQRSEGDGLSAHSARLVRDRENFARAVRGRSLNTEDGGHVNSWEVTQIY